MFESDINLLSHQLYKVRKNRNEETQNILLCKKIEVKSVFCHLNAWN